MKYLLIALALILSSCDQTITDPGLVTSSSSTATDSTTAISSTDVGTSSFTTQSITSSIVPASSAVGASSSSVNAAINYPTVDSLYSFMNQMPKPFLLKNITTITTSLVVNGLVVSRVSPTGGMTVSLDYTSEFITFIFNSDYLYTAVPGSPGMVAYSAPVLDPFIGGAKEVKAKLDSNLQQYYQLERYLTQKMYTIKWYGGMASTTNYFILEFNKCTNPTSVSFNSCDDQGRLLSYKFQ